MNSLTLLMIIIFLAGIYFYAKYADPKEREGLVNPKEVRCPNILLEKDSKFYLYNSKLAKVPGVNPVEFDNLEEYTEFLNWQHSQGIRCPVLYLQKTYDAQNAEVYKIRPSVSELQGGLPPSLPNQTKLVDASRNDKPYNINSMPGYDPSSYYVGTTTPLDLMDIQEQTKSLVSANPMDPNWGGKAYTQALVDSGAYANNTVKIQVQ